MKKYFLSICVVMVALSLSAFTGDYKKPVKTSDPGDMHWFTAPYNSSDFESTTQTAEARTLQNECIELLTEVECERAYRDDQLVIPGQPSSGVKTSEKNSPIDIIYVEEQ
ncbi:hypothetical protein LZZ85_02525 [Terrimonas sp. NA20]|uniref:Uncharacterized protein n=1 Tax=Terrimonas ginsenosidimutans TaxID=2908004 RepID=A0ABS9KLE4_9BACT|nr:hypothetical protein [Terrimonas ginsenosidimutans]MCG2613130.1 hypothetical protein [Terrimonas ginsenosidimutans]